MRASDAARQCDLAGDSYSLKRPFAKAIQAATWSRTGRIADALGLSQRTVETWGNPADPQHGPLWQLATIMREALAAGADESDALAPLRLLQSIFEPDTEANVELTRAASESIRESAESVAVTLESLRDGQIDALELERIDRETAEAIDKLRQLRAAAHTAAKESEAVRILTRRA
jgi:hypothetical protein